MTDLPDKENPAPEASVYEASDPAKVRKLRQKRARQRKALLDWIDKHLERDIDYGQIHRASKDICQHPLSCDNPYHYTKPFLYKPGAEKIQHYFGLKAFFPGARDYEKAALSGVAIGEVILVCEIYDAEGRFVCQGLGSCSVQDRSGRVNETLKMAKKRSFVDAIISATGLSQHFTQDDDDLTDANVAGEFRGKPRGQAKDERSQAKGSQRRPARQQKAVTRQKLKTLEKRIQETGIPVEKFCRAFGIDEVKALPDSQFGRAMQKLNDYEKAAAQRRRQNGANNAGQANEARGQSRSGNAAVDNC